MRRVVAAALLALALTAGCASETDGTPNQGSRSTATTPGTAVPSVAGSPGSSGPPAEGTGGPVTADAIDPCSLVTQAEANRVAGVTVQKAVRSLQLCTFPTPTSGSVGQLEVYVGDGAKKYLDIDRVDLGHEFHKVPDVGDQAFAEDGAIFFQGRGFWFGLRVTRLDEFDTGPLLAQLAAKVLDRV